MTLELSPEHVGAFIVGILLGFILVGALGIMVRIVAGIWRGL